MQPDQTPSAAPPDDPASIGPADPGSSRWRLLASWLWPPALYAVVVLLLYREVWLGLDGAQHWFGWDCLEMHWPDLSFLAGALGDGHWPLWNPYDRGGYPFLADTQTGLYYPLTWLFVAPGAAGGVPGWVAQAHVLAMHAIAGITMHAYLRSRGLRAAAAALGGVAWIVSGPMIIHKAGPVIWAMVWAPLVWIAVDRLIERARAPGWWRRSAGLAGALYLSASAGPPQGFFYVLLATAPYGLLRLTWALVDARRDGRLRDELTRQLRGLGLAALATAVLLAILFVPASEVLAFSPRASRSLDYNLSNPNPAGAALRGLVCPALGGIQLYGGVLVLALAVTALVMRARADRGAPILFFTVAAAALVLSFGAATPLLSFLVRHVPGFGLFREANRYKLLFELALVPVAAHGFHSILEADPARRRRSLVVALALIAALLCLWAILRAVAAPVAASPGDPAPGPGATGLILGAIALLLGGLWIAGERIRPLVAAALVAVAYLDVASFAQRSVRITERPVDDQEDRRFLAGLGDVEREWRLFDEYVMEQRPGSRLGVRDFRGYPSGDPFELVRYQDVLHRLGRTPQLLEAFNVRWVLHGPHHRNQKGSNYIKQPPSKLAPDHFRALDGRRFEALHPVPAVAWYRSVRLVRSGKQALATLPALEDAGGARRAALVERGDVPAAAVAALERMAAAPESTPLVPGRVVSLEPDRVVTEVDAPGAGLVVSNEVHYPGWRATVDGAAADGFRVNYLLRGVLVEPGHHTIVWTFAPARYGWLAALWLGGLGFLLAALAPARIGRGLGRFARRRRLGS